MTVLQLLAELDRLQEEQRQQDLRDPQVMIEYHQKIERLRQKIERLKVERRP